MDTSRSDTLLLCISFIAVTTSGIAGDYSGYKLVNLYVTSSDHLDLVHSWHSEDGIDVWVLPHSYPSNVSVLVTKDTLNSLKTTLDSHALEFTVTAHNIQSLVDEERASIGMSIHRSGLEGEFNFGTFNSYDQINKYLKNMCRDTPYCRLMYVGRSFEGRDLIVVKFSTSGSPRPGIWIDAGIHAREWLAPATAMYMIKKIADGILAKDNDIMVMLTNFDLYVLPLMNPDGYEYSRISDRFWRKTRSGTEGRLYGDDCVGVDANRNWDFHWMETGASDNPCSEIYAGPYAFSEPETRAVRDFLTTYKDHLVAYLSFHAYGQFWLYPWGYTSDLPDDNWALQFVAEAAAEAIRKHSNKEFILGTSTNVLYSAAGGSDDWAKGVLGIPFSYTIELRDEGSHGFLVPQEQIQESGEEMMAGFKAFSDALFEFVR